MSPTQPNGILDVENSSLDEWEYNRNDTLARKEKKKWTYYSYMMNPVTPGRYTVYDSQERARRKYDLEGLSKVIEEIILGLKITALGREHSP